MTDQNKPNLCVMPGCSNLTSNRYNIKLKPVHVCESCAMAITAQQVHWWAGPAEDKSSELKK